MGLIIESFPVGSFQCNCTILGCEETGEATVIDPGDEPRKILAALAKHKLTVRHVVHTHAHIDHIGATGAVRRACGGEVALHKEDMFLYDAMEMQCRMLGMPEPEIRVAPDNFLEHGDTFKWGKAGAAEVLHTPGHTPGSLCFRIEAERPVLFTGDTLFMGSIGRTDLWGGDYRTIMESIRDRILPLGDDVVIVPGHGPASTLGKEKGWNPFVQELMG